jgi:hypothetical protein
MITTPKADGLFFILYLPAGGVSTHFSCRFLFLSPLSFDKSRDTHTSRKRKGERVIFQEAWSPLSWRPGVMENNRHKPPSEQQTPGGMEHNNPNTQKKERRNKKNKIKVDPTQRPHHLYDATAVVVVCDARRTHSGRAHKQQPPPPFFLNFILLDIIVMPFGS